MIPPSETNSLMTQHNALDFFFFLMCKRKCKSIIKKEIEEENPKGNRNSWDTVGRAELLLLPWRKSDEDSEGN